MIEYIGVNINALGSVSFYEDGKMNYQFETIEFTCHFIKSYSLTI